MNAHHEMLSDATAEENAITRSVATNDVNPPPDPGNNSTPMHPFDALNIGRPVVGKGTAEATFVVSKRGWPIIECP